MTSLIPAVLGRSGACGRAELPSRATAARTQAVAVLTLSRGPLPPAECFSPRAPPAPRTSRKPTAVEANGDTGYDGQRLGGYAKYTFDLTRDMPLELTLAAGHQFISGSGNGGDSGATGFGGGPGTYGTVEIDASF